MKAFIFVCMLVAITLPSLAWAHGGGCRKADLPQCCHMDNSTGIVHCH